MVIHDEKPKAQRAAQTYMAVAVIGGLAMLMGIFLIKYNVGTTNYVELFEAVKSFIHQLKLSVMMRNLLLIVQRKI